MPKILLIQPSQYLSRGSVVKQKKLYLPGLVFPLLASIIPEHWEVEANLEVIDDIDLDTDADIIGIGGMGHAIYRAFDLADEFKKREKIVFMGGYMASMIPDITLEHVDSVIIGDAEISLLKLLEDFERDGHIQKRYENPLTSIDDLPVPKYEMLAEKSIGDMLPVQAGRGCNHQCSYCSIACLYKGQHLVRPIKDVIRDIKKIKSLGYKKFYIIDDNLVANPKYLAELCEQIKPLNMKWSSQCTMNLAKNKKLLQKVADAGCEILSLGIESISQDGLDKLNKKWLKAEKHGKLVKAFNQAGIMVSAEMMIGLDSDTVDSIKATYDFIEKVKLPLVRVYILTPIPATEFYNQIKRENRFIHENYRQYTASNVVHIPKSISPEDLQTTYKWLNQKLFSIKSIFARTLFNPQILKHPFSYLFAFVVNLHYRSYVKKGETPLIL